MIKLKQPQIVDDTTGKPIVLTPREKYHADYMQKIVNERFQNDLAYEISITTLSTIVKKVSQQKYFQVAPADYLPVKVGEGTWGSNLVTYRSFNIADEFENGIINTGGQNARLATADAGVDSVTVQINNWAKSVFWSVFDLEEAAKSGNWDLVAAKEKARKENWDLGIQRVAFLGARGLNGAQGKALGLLNQAGITTNTAVITKAIHTMTETELNTFMGTVVEAYRSNVNRTAWPNRFVVPESDYNGLASFTSATFPLKTKLEALEMMFKTITMQKDFKILPLPYSDAAYHTDIPALVGKQVYALYNYDEESIRVDIPLDYTNTLANSLDNFSFQNAGYGQFTGAQAYRPLELMYFTYNV